MTGLKGSQYLPNVVYYVLFRETRVMSVSVYNPHNNPGDCTVGVDGEGILSDRRIYSGGVILRDFPRLDYKHLVKFLLSPKFRRTLWRLIYWRCSHVSFYLYLKGEGKLKESFSLCWSRESSHVVSQTQSVHSCLLKRPCPSTFL